MKTAASRSLLVGIGNAGVSVLDRIAIEFPALQGMLVINNDADSLNASVVEKRIVLPCHEEADVSSGFLAIEEEFCAAIRGASSVIFCGGLGGELGSFLIPALAACAKADGITTLASVGIPFSFEGRQKRESAASALLKLHDLCDGVAVIENDRLAGGVPSTAAVGEAFVAADRVLQSSLLALQGMLATSGPVKISRSDLASVLGTSGSMTHFGHGRAEGANRLHEALEDALKSPLLTLAGKGSALKEASSVLLLLSGPADLSFAEVQRSVSELERMAGERCQVKVGVHAGEAQGARLELFLLASSGGASRKAVAPPKVSAPTPASAPEEQPAPAETPARVIPPEQPEPQEMQPEPSVKKAPSVKESKGSKTTKAGPSQQTQGVFDLESYQRGRFDKSEPTIVEGEDLDIPTFLRKGIKLGAALKH
jgi:cell division protein FtsZ